MQSSPYPADPSCDNPDRSGAPKMLPLDTAGHATCCCHEVLERLDHAYESGFLAGFRTSADADALADQWMAGHVEGCRAGAADAAAALRVEAALGEHPVPDAVTEARSDGRVQAVR